MDDLFAKATNPAQYDLQEIDWSGEHADSPMRRFFMQMLEQNMGSLAGKDVLDVGSGTGYCSELYKKLDAKSAAGLEPSANNVALSQKFYPDFPVTRGTLEDLVERDAYDVVVSVMVFEHIAHPAAAFATMARALRSGGTFILICGDRDVLLEPKFDYIIHSKELTDGEYAASTTRSNGTTYDILRPTENYVRYAELAGLSLASHIPLTSSEALIAAWPQFEAYRTRPFAHLLRFAKP